MNHRHLTLMLLVAAGCSADERPDARVIPPLVRFDAAVATPDAAVADEVDAAPGEPDAPIVEEVDAAPGEEPDAAPDAPAGEEADASTTAPPAHLIINEVNANLGTRALIELYVTEGGTTKGWRLERDYRTGATIIGLLPDVVVETGDLIVIHMTPGAGTVIGETTSKSQFHTTENYDGAWDFLGTNDTVGIDNRILALRDPDGVVDSIVPFFRPDIVDPARTFFPGDVQAAIDAGLWNETCVPSPCSYSSNLDAVTVVWTGLGDTPEGASVSRKPGAVNDGKASDWQAVPTEAPLNTLGAPN